jgi:hypothetical protein
MSSAPATNTCVPEGTNLSATHKDNCSADNDSCSAHKDNRSGHNDSCSAHSSRCAAHKDSCSAHKSLSPVLSERSLANKYLSRPHNWGCVALYYLSPADKWWSPEDSTYPRACSGAPLKDCEWPHRGSDLPSALRRNCAEYLFLHPEDFQLHVADPEKRWSSHLLDRPKKTIKAGQSGTQKWLDPASGYLQEMEICRRKGQSFAGPPFTHPIHLARSISLPRLRTPRISICARSLPQPGVRKVP